MRVPTGEAAHGSDIDNDGLMANQPPAPPGARVSAAGLTHTYAGPNGPLTVIDHVSFEVPSGGYLAVTGPSGAGKSTLLALLGGLEAPQRGTLKVADSELATMNSNQLAAYRSSVVGFVFQHFGLLESLTATENIELACMLSGVGQPERRERAGALLEAVGLAHRKDHRPLHLSGGERQRVAIARSLANSPSLVLADEPTGNLDEDSTHTVIELLEEVVRERGTTLVVVTHNSELANRARQRLMLEQGHMVGPTP